MCFPGKLARDGKGKPVNVCLQRAEAVDYSGSSATTANRRSDYLYQSPAAGLGNLRCEKRRFLRNVAPKIKMLPSCCECSCTKYTRWAQILCFLTISLSVLVQSCFQTNTFTNRSFWIQIIFFPLPHDTTALTSASTMLVSSFGVEQTEPSHSEQHNTKFRCEFVV